MKWTSIRKASIRLTSSLLVAGGVVLHPDVLQQGNWFLKDSKGQLEYWRKDPLMPGQYRRYGTEKGEIRGTIRRDPLVPKVESTDTPTLEYEILNNK